MAVTLKKGSSYMTEESRIIRVSSKNQITIPQKFAESLGLDKEVECVLRENEIIIRRFVKTSENFEDYSDLILRDLIAQGLQDNELLLAFTEAKRKMRAAGQKIRQEALVAITKDARDSYQVHADIFGDQED
jgi:bifunctional DNA-binding transcriptional regulator/antitoxin component of YhaV-PrlF toxin-antitoxin module